MLGYLSFLILFLLPTLLQACPICYGDPASPMTEGMNAAIFTLLGITGGMLAMVGMFFLHLRKRWTTVNRRFRNLLN